MPRFGSRQANVCLLVPALLFATIGPVRAQVSGSDSGFYYEIGGAAPLGPAANGAVVSVPVGFSASLALNNSCSGFDPSLTVTHLFNTLRDSVDDLGSAITGAVQGAIAALPWYILQRANPGLYDILQNALLRFERSIELATQSCEQILTATADGKNPFDEWITLSVGEDWRLAAGAGGLNVVNAKKAIDDRAGDNGVRWVGGRRGGLGQPPIRVIGDTVRAGFNVTLGRRPDAGGAVGGHIQAPLTRLWSSPAAAAHWATGAFGDLLVTTCRQGIAGCPATQGQPGTGLTPQQEEEQQAVLERLVNLLDGGTSPTPAQLEAVSAPGVELSWGLLQSLLALPEESRLTATRRLAGEIATARTVEKALYVRRLILAGRQTPDVAGAAPAQALLDRKVAEIDREIDNLLFENRVRKELVSATAAAVMEAVGTRRLEAGAPPAGTVETATPLEHGATPRAPADD